MKNKLWLVIAVLFVVIMIGASVLYPRLSENHIENTKDISVNNEASQSTQKNTNEPEKATDFYVYDTSLNKVRLSDNFGKPIVINFWASWCGPCISELPYFDTMYQKYKDDVTFMMVNLTDGQRDTVEGIKKFVSDKGYSFPVYYDADYDAAINYGVRSIPETVFINADGSIFDIRIGAMNESSLEGYITELLENK